jgi:hypothetical protein
MQLTHTNKTKGSHKPVMAHQIFYHQNMHNCYKLDSLFKIIILEIKQNILLYNISEKQITGKIKCQPVDCVPHFT